MKAKSFFTLSRIAIVLGAFLPAAQTFGAPFMAGDIVVLQVNSTSNAVTPTSAASPVFLSEFTTAGSPVQSLAMPTAASGGNNPLTISGTAASEGALSLSANGQYLVLAGYNQTPGGTTQGTSTVGLVSASGNINTSTTTTLLSGNNTRAATSVDGTGVWVTGPTGLVYETTGSSGGTSVDTHVNYRDINVATASVSPTGGEELYGSSNNATKPAMGISDLSPALPNATGATATILNGMTATTAPDSYGFFFANPTTLFVADANKGIQEWTLSGTTWSEVATLAGSYVGLTGVQVGNTVQLYATTGTSAAAGRVNGNSLVSDVFTYTSDHSGPGTFAAPTTLATATADYGFAGVSFVPVPEPATGVLAALGLLGIAFYGWRRRAA